MATTNARSVGTSKKSAISDSEREEKINKARQMSQNAKAGSLTAKANMVSRYNSGQVTQLPEEKTEETESGKKKNSRKKK